jgi:hypothetical protein
MVCNLHPKLEKKSWTSVFSSLEAIRGKLLVGGLSHILTEPRLSLELDSAVSLRLLQELFRLFSSGSAGQCDSRGLAFELSRNPESYAF